jgi:anaerobic selenocysteine-containing dehydrogenase
MISRRIFFQAGAAFAASSLVAARPAAAHDTDVEMVTGKAISPWSGVEYDATPSTCALCPSRCPILAFTDNGRLAKIQGNPASARTMGKLCARGQAGVEQVYDPDRILWPMRRVGKRGEGRWQRISWELALQELATRISRLREAGTPERLMLLHGWLSTGSERLVRDLFFGACGSATVAGPESLGRAARNVAHQLTWGGATDNWDLANARYVLNFGSNFLEAHTNHIALARRFATAAVDQGQRLVTFDVRLSNTAARSNLWVPIRPGTDLAVILAMCQVIMSEGLYQAHGEAFLAYCRASADTTAGVAATVDALTTHLEPYTPEWAQELSGVPAARIRAIATDFATAYPACVISHRGASNHWNGVETERAIQMLAAITGNIDNPGGRCRSADPGWVTPTLPDDALPARRLEILSGAPGAARLPLDGVGHQALRQIRDGAAGRPEVLIWYGHNPVQANGDVAGTHAILADEELLPFTVAVSPFYDEAAALADLILPDATYLESWDLEQPPSPDQVAEYAIRQPALPPQGEARDFKDVVCELADLIGVPLGVKSAEDLVRQACKLTPIIKKQGGRFPGMKKNGLYRDAEAPPRYHGYAAELGVEELEADGVILDPASGVYWNWQQAGAASAEEAQAQGFAAFAGARAAYVGQRIGDRAVVGFPPDKVAKSGLFELHSATYAALGLPPLPTWQPIDAHAGRSEEQLVMTTFKVNVQTQWRTQNSRWLQEIRYDNAAWIHPATATERGLTDGAMVRVRSATGEVLLAAHVTEAVIPGVVAVSAHFGRTEHGRFAAGKRSPVGVDDPKLEQAKWWLARGGNVNLIVPVSADPIAGQQCWMDTLVTVTPA